jgi:hypothetical protein
VSLRCVSSLCLFAVSLRCQMTPWGSQQIPNSQQQQQEHGAGGAARGAGERMLAPIHYVDREVSADLHGTLRNFNSEIEPS